MLTGACGDADRDARDRRTAVTVTLQDFSVSLDPSRARSGVVALDVVNVGPSLHEFLLLRTDQPADLLPTDARGNVDEESPDLEPIEKVSALEADETTAVEADLSPGDYVVICNLPGHYGQGMHAALIVE
jgi:uncharacterized cupredoxin-like copper-binding protein